MKKYLPFIVAGVALLTLSLVLLFVNYKPKKLLNERITLKQKDKIPYGFYTAYALLPSLFPTAKVASGKQWPYSWDTVTSGGNNQAIFLIGDLKANEKELQELVNFVQKGNYVFIIGKNLSYDARYFFGLNASSFSSDEDYYADSNDSLRMRLNGVFFKDTTTYVYPGRRFSNSLAPSNNTKGTVLGTNEKGRINFMQFKAGAGSIFIHSAPLAFSNYFLLHKNNVAYYQQAVSVIPANVKVVFWSEYYLAKREGPKEKEPAWLSVLFRYPAFKAAFLTALATLLLFVVLEARRKQRAVPVLQKGANDSVHFVQTIGRLYYDQKNHKDLAQKMSTYFLDHVRSRYKMSTNNLDEAFTTTLHLKSGYAVSDLQTITDFIELAFGDPFVTEDQLARFHRQLEHFYKNT